MPTPINSSSANQEAYRAQVASSRSEKQLASMTNSLKATEKMATAMGLDTAGIQNTLKTVSASQEPASSSTKVSLSADGVAKSQSERPAQAASPTATSRAEKRQFQSIDEALAYGASQAAEQAGNRSPAKTGSTGETTAANTQNEAAAANRQDKKAFASVDEAIAYGTQRALAQYAKQQSAISG